MYSDLQSRHYCRCLTKAFKAAHRLLTTYGSRVDSNEIHAVKSLLYAAIGHVEINVDRQEDVKRMLRELMSIILLSADLQEEDRRAGLHILGDLNVRCGLDPVSKDGQPCKPVPMKKVCLSVKGREKTINNRYSSLYSSLLEKIS